MELGGLWVLPKLINKNPQKIVYIGDTKHFPYGEKLEELIQFLLLNRITDLLNHNAETIGIACNTATIAFAKLRPSKYITSKIIGTIDCTSKYLGKRKCNNIGVIGTHYTVTSNAYTNTIKKYDKKEKVYFIESAEQKLVLSVEKADKKIYKKKFYE